MRLLQNCYTTAVDGKCAKGFQNLFIFDVPAFGWLCLGSTLSKTYKSLGLSKPQVLAGAASAHGEHETAAGHKALTCLTCSHLLRFMFESLLTLLIDRNIGHGTCWQHDGHWMLYVVATLHF